MAISVLIIYLCVIGMIAAVGKYLGELGLVLYAAAIVYSCFYAVWTIYSFFRQKQKLRMGELFTLLAYLLAVLYVTIFMRTEGTNTKVQMEVLNWLLSAGKEGTEDFQHILLNVAMFVPVGALAAMVTDGVRGKVLNGVSFGLFFSTAIETGQLILRSGTCDIDDILANTFGALVGAVCISIWRRKTSGSREKSGKRRR